MKYRHTFCSIDKFNFGKKENVQLTLALRSRKHLRPWQKCFLYFSLKYKVLVAEFTINRSLYLLLKQARSYSDVVQMVSSCMPRVCLNAWRFVVSRLPQGHLEGSLRHVLEAGSVNYSVVGRMHKYPHWRYLQKVTHTSQRSTVANTGKCSPQYFSKQEYVLFLSDVWKISIWTVEFSQPSLLSGGKILIIGSPGWTWEAKISEWYFTYLCSVFTDSLQLCGSCR